jgi:two-component system sensor histidine kinase BaeS
LRLGVTDTGSGITPEELPRIWDRFARAADARAQGKAGSGLGLAIVRGLTEAMNGTVGAESTRYQGTTIWIELNAENKTEKDLSTV